MLASMVFPLWMDDNSGDIIIFFSFILTAGYFMAML